MIRRPPRSTLFPYTNALPIYQRAGGQGERRRGHRGAEGRRPRDLRLHRAARGRGGQGGPLLDRRLRRGDRKSTRLNSSHLVISDAVFCLKKKKKKVKSYEGES